VRATPHDKPPPSRDGASSRRPTSNVDNPAIAPAPNAAFRKPRPSPAADVEQPAGQDGEKDPEGTLQDELRPHEVDDQPRPAVTGEGAEVAQELAGHAG